MAKNTYFVPNSSTKKSQPKRPTVDTKPVNDQQQVEPSTGLVSNTHSVIAGKPADFEFWGPPSGLLHCQNK